MTAWLLAICRVWRGSLKFLAIVRQEIAILKTNAVLIIHVNLLFAQLRLLIDIGLSVRFENRLYHCIDNNELITSMMFYFIIKYDTWMVLSREPTVVIITTLEIKI